MSGPAPDALRDALRLLAAGQPLGGDAVTAAFDVVMRGEATPAQIAGLLIALRVRGESGEVVAAVVRAMRSVMVPLPVDDPDALVDTCGTGGGTVQTFNISTAAALLAAGAGARVAKHGNRSNTTRSGSADVLEALGVPIDCPPERMRRVLDQAGIVFMFAPAMHPAMRHVGPVRRELAIPTVMNMVGPLANPASAGRQVVGVAEVGRLPLMAGALASLGSVHAMVVYGEPGLDEISPLGPTRVLEVRRGRATPEAWTIDPAEHGFAGVRESDLAGGSPEENAGVILEVLAGGGPAGAQAAVVLNAAAALYVAGIADSYADGIGAARRALERGDGLRALDRMRAAYGDA
ncbi:Anthranilate phosphoribosyltransferase [Gemmatirosa kalamazoonensis]|uniref:Anthranilate phosphoribosyltransferase n=1 Tax=Gemmatirosa kalamazoonensis TaxID=861299 RepID=W0RIH5_9BACT|nr:anthranilate phosphoribosyltransferase [Gemmatirosa kalamazoonensis]AHG90904.1 Anthranilate phosphoribosyltransferase [Gemmatirosa kalamazoonensis]